MRSLAAVLVHHPVVDRRGDIVTTAITNLDLHDIARSAHTYGVEPFFVAHPVRAQRELARRIREHWITGTGARRIPDRRPAMEALTIVGSLDEALSQLGGRDSVELWTTSARKGHQTMEYSTARERLGEAGPQVVLLFGTGWGLAPELLAAADGQLAPILSPRPDGYNHLSVRAAAAITFDRLLSKIRVPGNP